MKSHPSLAALVLFCAGCVNHFEQTYQRNPNLDSARLAPYSGSTEARKHVRKGGQSVFETPVPDITHIPVEEPANWWRWLVSTASGK
jgi:hypothetical protein